MDSAIAIEALRKAFRQELRDAEGCETRGAQRAKEAATLKHNAAFHRARANELQDVIEELGIDPFGGDEGEPECV